MSQRPIGRVTATENRPTSCTTVRFWVQEDEIIRPFDIVRIRHLKGSSTYAIVTNLEYMTDSAGHLANYVSADFGDVNAQPQNPRLGTTIAEADVLYNDYKDQPIEMPIRDGEPVEWADEDGIREALGLKALRNAIPAGYLQMSNGTEVSVEFENDFLIGPEGAHLNISGISGLATKTSYAMFLLNAMQQKQPEKVAQIIFNVKGLDLLRVDEMNPTLTDKDKAEWAKCGLEPRPFSNVRYLHPYSRNKDRFFSQSRLPKDVLERQAQLGILRTFIYDVPTIKGTKERSGSLPLLFADIDDPNNTMDSIAVEMAEVDAESWQSFRSEVESRTRSGNSKGKDIQVGSYRKFSRLLRTRTSTNDVFTERSDNREKRQTSVADAVRQLRNGEVLVIDIEPLPDFLQCLVVGDVMRTIYGMKSGDEDAGSDDSFGTVVIFADELNKYAPKGFRDQSTLTQKLLEVTERGRSLGVVLFGAEQFRSGVHDRVLGNCGTNAFGRTSPVEVAKCPDYKYFPDTYKSAITRLPKGTLLLQHAAFKTSLIRVRFPFAAYFQPKGR